MVYILSKFNQIYEAIKIIKQFVRAKIEARTLKVINKLYTRVLNSYLLSFLTKELQNNFKVLIKTVTRNDCSLPTTTAGTGAANI